MPFKKPKEEITVDLMMNYGKFDYIYSVENGKFRKILL